MRIIEDLSAPGQNGKRAQCNLGAKNHAIVLPDADPESVVNQLVGASCGAAGGPNVALKMLMFSETYCFFPSFLPKLGKKRHGKTSSSKRFREAQDPTSDLSSAASPLAPGQRCMAISVAVFVGASKEWPVGGELVECPHWMCGKIGEKIGHR